MMDNFIYDIPTKVYFGAGQLQQLHTILQTMGKNVLLVYGGGSIHANGIYDQVMRELQTAQKTCAELSGVEANPSINTVQKGVDLCHTHNIDVLLAVGGGSVIDCAKVIAAASLSEEVPWNLVVHPDRITQALPIIAVPTIAATGSEMDHIGVITNPQTKEKIGTRHPLLRPKVAILDPTFTYSVNAYQTSCGVADIMSHVMETYFAHQEAALQDRFAEGILKVCITYGTIAVKHPDNYEARANLMWAASWAINDFLKLGHMTPWSVHPMEHPLSARYNVTHGEGLAVLTPNWMSYVLGEDTVTKFAHFAKEIWNVPSTDPWDMAREGIAALTNFFTEDLGLRTSLHELGVQETDFDEMAADAARQTVNGYVKLQAEDVKKIYQNSL